MLADRQVQMPEYRTEQNLDPSIAYLRSVNPAVKALMQRVKDAHENEMQQRLRRFVWPERYDEYGFHREGW
jgi:hypothetical protein